MGWFADLKTKAALNAVMQEMPTCTDLQLVKHYSGLLRMKSDDRALEGRIFYTTTMVAVELSKRGICAPMVGTMEPAEADVCLAAELWEKENA